MCWTCYLTDSPCIIKWFEMSTHIWSPNQCRLQFICDGKRCKISYQKYFLNSILFDAFDWSIMCLLLYCPKFLYLHLVVKYFDKFHVICIIIDMITHYKIEENDYKTMTCRFTIFDTNTHSSCGIYCIYFLWLKFYFVCVVVGSYKMIECRGYWIPFNS